VLAELRLPWGAFYRRLSARIGKAKAVTATARKIAVLFYNALRHGWTMSTRALPITSFVTESGSSADRPAAFVAS